jgi:hypothetical protein
MESDTPELTHQGFGIDGGSLASPLQLGHGHFRQRVYIGLFTVDYLINLESDSSSYFEYETAQYSFNSFDSAGS